MTLAKLLDIIIPRLLTEEVALTDDGDHYQIVCSMADVRPGERFDAVATMRTFNLFGMALFPKLIGEPRPWPGTPTLIDTETPRTEQVDAVMPLIGSLLDTWKATPKDLKDEIRDYGLGYRIDAIAKAMEGTA